MELSKLYEEMFVHGSRWPSMHPVDAHWIHRSEWDSMKLLCQIHEMQQMEGVFCFIFFKENVFSWDFIFHLCQCINYDWKPASSPVLVCSLQSLTFPVLPPPGVPGAGVGPGW